MKFGVYFFILISILVLISISKPVYHNYKVIDYGINGNNINKSNR